MLSSFYTNSPFKEWCKIQEKQQKHIPLEYRPRVFHWVHDALSDKNMPWHSGYDEILAYTTHESGGNTDIISSFNEAWTLSENIVDDKGLSSSSSDSDYTSSDCNSTSQDGEGESAEAPSTDLNEEEEEEGEENDESYSSSGSENDIESRIIRPSNKRKVECEVCHKINLDKEGNDNYELCKVCSTDSWTSLKKKRSMGLHQVLFEEG